MARPHLGLHFVARLPKNSSRLLGQAVINANASDLDRVVVVLGRASEELRTSVDFGRAVVVENTAYGMGGASSLLAGMDTAGEDYAKPSCCSWATSRA